MVYRRGLFVKLFAAAILVVAATSVEAGSTKIAYKKPIYGKANAIKEKHVKPKPELNKKASVATATTPPPSPPPPALAPAMAAKEPTTTTTPMPTAAAASNEASPAAPANGASGEEQEVKFLVGQKGLQEAATATVGEPSVEKPKEHNSEDADDIDFKNDSADAGDELDETLAVQLAAPATTTTTTTTKTTDSKVPVPCTCGVFMGSQIKRGSNEQPQGMPVIMNELDRNFPCNPIGQKQCQTKCLETIVQHLPNSANILCATLNRDCRKERAYLFIKNCHNHWWNTNLAAGREYCCRNGKPYQCPMV